MSDDNSILLEAHKLTRGERNQDYGNPLEEHDRIAKFWSIILNTQVTAEQVAMCMVTLKIARQMHRPKRDNAVDMAGYSDCLQRIIEARLNT